MELLLSFLLNLFITSGVYMLVPAILCACGKKLPLSKIRWIIIVNGICAWLIFAVLRMEAGLEGTSAAVFFWSAVGYWLMKRYCLIEGKNEAGAAQNPQPLHPAAPVAEQPQLIPSGAPKEDASSASISEAPSTKITGSTALEICDDIWAGTIHFAKEAGFSTHPLVTTVLWSGFLLSVKKELDKHELLRKVQGQFIHSLARIYDYGPETAEQQADLENRMHTFYDALAADVADLESERNIFEFVSIAANVNARFSPSSKVSPMKCVDVFQRTASLLSSHIYCIIHDIDNKVLLQFPRPALTAAQPAPTQPVPQQPKPQPAANATPAAARKEKDNGTPRSFAWLCAILLIIFAVVVIVTGIRDGLDGAEMNQDNALTAQSKPVSGTIVDGKRYYDDDGMPIGYGDITVTASSGADCVVCLKTPAGNNSFSFYVRAGDTVTIASPYRKAYVYFSTGSTWYGFGEGLMFGSGTDYSKDDELLDFANYNWEYTLYPVSNGNFSETPIDEDEFFD